MTDKKEDNKDVNKQHSRNELFVFFIRWMLAIMLLYGIGMMTVILFGDDAVLATRLVSGFSTMFAAMLGFGSGYLLARGVNGNGNGNGYK